VGHGLGLYRGVDRDTLQVLGRQRVNDERSNGSRWQNTSSPQKYW
jgi:hypothetical protein